ncbi:MAG: hypothetical protein AB1540_08285 [Bdellovibrionota bacterium]
MTLPQGVEYQNHVVTLKDAAQRNNPSRVRSINIFYSGTPILPVKIKNGPKISISLTVLRSKEDPTPRPEKIDKFQNGHLNLLFGDIHANCKKIVEQRTFKSLEGYCAEEIIVEMPDKPGLSVEVNGIAYVNQDPKNLNATDLLMRLRWLNRYSSAEHRKRLVAEYFSRTDASARTAIADDILLGVKTEEERNSLKTLFTEVAALDMNTDGNNLAVNPLTEALYPNTLSIDLRDLAYYREKEVPEAKLILRAIEMSPKVYLPQGKNLENILGIEIVDIQRHQYYLNALVEVRRSVHKIFKYEVRLSDDHERVDHVQVLDEIPLEQVAFRLHLGLKRRILIIESPGHKIRKLYPVGVGGFFEAHIQGSGGKTRLMTPIIRGGTVRRNTTISKRFEPAYFGGFPFIPLTSPDHLEGERGLEGFHIAQGALNILQRGFVSHGCVHLTERNLMELHAIVMFGKYDVVPLEATLEVSLQTEHPYPLYVYSYESVSNCSAEGEKARSCKEQPLEEFPPLTKIDTINGPPPIERLGH